MKRHLSVLIALLLAIAMLFSSCAVPDSDGVNNDGTSENGGNTEGGNTEGGNTEGGNTEGGNTEGGNTEGGNDDNEQITVEKPALTKPALDLSTIPEYDGTKLYVAVNGNVPSFTVNQYTKEAYEYYTELDALGRCGIAVAVLGTETMPGANDERGSISHVSPSGWHGNGIYERSHLIAWALSNESANTKNLITGTYDLNGVMQEFETMVLRYIKETGNHVLYRVVPIFEGNNLLASGVQMEAYSVEDEGEGIYFNIYIYNAQENCDIDYLTGDYEHHKSDCRYVLNTNSKKIHKPDCSSVHDISDKNKQETDKTLSELKAEGYSPCGKCKPTEADEEVE